MNIAVLLPAPFEGGIIRSASNIVRMLVLGARACGDDLQVSFGYPRMDATRNWSFPQLEELGVSVRPFRMEEVPAGVLAPYFSTFVKPLNAEPTDTYGVFNDGVSNFEEADMWLIISDQLPYILPPHKPYAVVVYDFVQRYVPEIYWPERWKSFEKQSAVVRNAAFVVTTTRQTKTDVVTYIGYPPARVEVFPIEFDPLAKGGAAGADSAPVPSIRKRIVWPTIISQHEGHEGVLSGLEIFLSGNPEYEVVVLGFGVQSLDPRQPSRIDHPTVTRIRNRIAKSQLLGSRLSFPGYVDDDTYQSLIREAAMLLHTSRFDNGSYTVVEAAWLRTPALSARYAAMEEIGAQFGLPLEFFDANDPADLARKIGEVVRDRAAICGRMPARESLMSHSYAGLAVEYWTKFRSLAATAVGVQA